MVRSVLAAKIQKIYRFFGAITIPQEKAGRDRAIRYYPPSYACPTGYADKNRKVDTATVPCP